MVVKKKKIRTATKTAALTIFRPGTANKHMTNQGTGGESLQGQTARRRRSYEKKSWRSSRFLCMGVQKLAARFSFHFLCFLSLCPSAVFMFSHRVAETKHRPSSARNRRLCCYIFRAQSSSTTTSKALLAKYPILPVERTHSPSRTRAMSKTKTRLLPQIMRTICCNAEVVKDVMLPNAR